MEISSIIAKSEVFFNKKTKKMNLSLNILTDILAENEIEMSDFWDEMADTFREFADYLEHYGALPHHNQPDKFEPLDLYKLCAITKSNNYVMVLDAWRKGKKNEKK